MTHPAASAAEPTKRNALRGISAGGNELDSAIVMCSFATRCQKDLANLDRSDLKVQDVMGQEGVGALAVFGNAAAVEVTTRICAPDPT
ncbi:hypothetical protein [Myceligenerans halotolerans]